MSGTGEWFTDLKLSGSACNDGRGVDVGTSGAFRLVARLCARGEGRRRWESGRYEQVLEVFAAFVGCHRWQREDVGEAGIRLDEGEVPEDNVSDGYVVGMEV